MQASFESLYPRLLLFFLSAFPSPLTNREFFGPLHSGCGLHHHEESQNRSDGDGQAGLAIKKEGVREQDQVYELRQPRFKSRESESHN